jgi:hypothetical protein
VSLPQIGQCRTNQEPRHNKNRENEEAFDHGPDESRWRYREPGESQGENEEDFQEDLVHTLKTYVKAVNGSHSPPKPAGNAAGEQLTAHDRHEEYLKNRIDQAVQRGDYSTSGPKSASQGNDWYDNFDSDGED